jgi:hypothetical protein
MKIFLEHGASSNAMSKPHYGQPRRMPWAIVQKFPAPVAVEAAELKSMIGDALVRSRPRDYDHEILQQAMATCEGSSASSRTIVTWVNRLITSEERDLKETLALRN